MTNNFKENILSENLLENVKLQLSNLITIKKQLKDLYCTCNGDDYIKKANEISFKVRNYIKWTKLLNSLNNDDFNSTDTITKCISSKSLLTKIIEINDTKTLKEIENTNNIFKDIQEKITNDFISKKENKNSSFLKNQKYLKKAKTKHSKYNECDISNLQRVNGIGEKKAIKFLDNNIKLENFLEEWNTIFKKDNFQLVPDEYLNLKIEDMNKMAGIRQSYITDKFASTIYLKHLHYSQLIGIKYFHDIEKRIPRKEIEQMDNIITKVLKTMKNKDIISKVCGSYRRGNKDSGDIDILLWHPLFKDYDSLSCLNNNNNILLKLVKVLSSVGFLYDHITVDGNTKYMGICKVKSNPYRRIDIRFIPYNSLASALLYFTGSANLNKKMRMEAQTKGYKLNEYGLYKGYFDKKQNKEIFDEKFDTPTEESIFKLLDMTYLKPTDRNI